MTHTDDLGFAPDFDRARCYFRAQDGYAVSPLLHIKGPDGMAVLAKDETDRMGLGAFKALGAPYAAARIIEGAWQRQTGETLTPDRMKDADIRAFASDFTFVCASAGNHGIGVAAGARAMGAKARIHIAKTVPESFADRLRSHGGEVLASGDVYEDSVAAAITDAQTSGATLLADGTWPGYTEIPKWVMEGYCVIAEELREAFEASGEWPSHVYLQAGVGGLAAAMAHMIRLNWAVQPDLIIVEPERAQCLRASHLSGHAIRADGPESTMGRLDCKDPSIVAWDVLERCDVRYETVSEDESVAATDALAALEIDTTPSGAAGYAAVLNHPPAPSASSFLPLIIISEGPA